MGRFAREAPWIRRIFPASSAPATAVPSAVSEDVQLTQEYLANGQTQVAQLWQRSDGFVNPGQGNDVTMLAPISFNLSQGPEVWRVFFLDVEIPGAIAVAYDFQIKIVTPSNGNECLISQTLQIPIATGARINCYPHARAVEAFLATSGFVSTPSPLLLAADGTAGVASMNLVMTQLSAHVVSTVTLALNSVILRNPVGLAHVL